MRGPRAAGCVIGWFGGEHPFATGGSGTVSVRSGVLKDFEFPGKTGMDSEATCTDDIKCVHQG